MANLSASAKRRVRMPQTQGGHDKRACEPLRNRPGRVDDGRRPGNRRGVCAQRGSRRVYLRQRFFRLQIVMGGWGVLIGANVIATIATGGIKRRAEGI